MQKVVFATSNKNKVREVSEILKDFPFEIVTMKEMGIDIDIPETGMTYEENAYQKASAVFEIVKDKIVIADDSGFSVDALNGEPGIYSARYLGEDVPYSEKIKDILRRMKNVPDEERTCQFNCAVCALIPEGMVSEYGIEITRLAVVQGLVAKEPRGDNGFAFDPIFYYTPFGCTTAEMSAEQKNSISHRGIAFRMLRDVLLELFEIKG